MSENAFEHCRRLIHLSGELNMNHRVTITYDPLEKNRKSMGCIRAGWNAGKRITIDSMITYCGRDISFVQYLLKKPIKHGIQFFLCVVHILVISLVSRCILAKTQTLKKFQL